MKAGQREQMPGSDPQPQFAFLGRTKEFRMSVETNKAIVRKAFEAVNQQNLAAMDELMASDFYSHSAPPGMPPTRESHKQALNSLFSAFTDYHVTVEDLVAEADMPALRAAYPDATTLETWLRKTGWEQAAQ